MKRSERRHLKTNEVATSVARAREVVVERQRSVTAALIVAAVVVVAAAGYFGFRSRTQSRAGAMLAEAMAVASTPVTPPPSATPTGESTAPPPLGPSFPTEAARSAAAAEKFVAVAEAYPDTTAGLSARLKAATTQVELGRLAEAEQQYRDLVNRDSSGLYGRMAKLGLAELLLREGKYDEAIEGFKALVEKPDADLPLDGMLMQLGRAYEGAGKATEAKQAYNRIVEEFPQSLYASEARRQLDALGASPTVASS